jgi:DNA-binding NarL/FixJ family response regulator
MNELSEEKARIFLVDDHLDTLSSLKALINLEDDLTVIGCASNVADAMKGIQSNSPSAVVIDLDLGQESGFDLIQKLKSHSIRIPTLVLSMCAEGLYAEKAIRLGANGYLMKLEPVETIFEALRKVLNGSHYVSQSMELLLHKKGVL